MPKEIVSKPTIDPAVAAAAPRAAPAAAPGRAAATPMSRLLVGALASGLFVFACEVVFVHLLALLVGTSVYVFGLILFIFLVALSAGAGLAPLFSRRTKGAALALSFALTALALGATIPLWDRLPAVFVELGPRVASWGGRELVRGLVALAALAVPVTAMGMSFPILLEEAGRRADVARAVGRLTAVNTLGSIVGSLVGGFVVLPALGSQQSLVVVAAGYAVVAVLVGSRGPRRFVAPAVAALGLLVALVAPRWDLGRLAGGANVYFEAQLPQGAEVVWVTEDVHGGVTTVTEAEGLHTLYTNGKFQGDNGFQMAAQYGFANIPVMFVPRFGRALVIGMGTGTTLGALGAYPFEHIDLAELSPGILRAARRYFSRINGGILDDPRLEVLLEDGRNVLLVRDETYDLVSIELTSIWFAGAANLYNVEFYETAARRLRPGGVLQQWVQLHHTTRREIATTLATARAVFPHAILFVRGEQGILVLGREPLVASRARLGELEARPGVAMHLAKGEHLADAFDDAVLADETLDAFVDEVLREQGASRTELLSTDDNLRLEYATPRNNVPGLLSTYQTGAMLRRYRVGEVVLRHLAN